MFLLTIQPQPSSVWADSSTKAVRHAHTGWARQAHALGATTVAGTYTLGAAVWPGAGGWIGGGFATTTMGAGVTAGAQVAGHALPQVLHAAFAWLLRNVCECISW